MIRIQIVRNGVETNRADFLNVGLATKWLDDHKKKNVFGKNQRELIAKLDEQGNYFVPGEDVSLALSFREMVDSITGVNTRWYLFPADYQVITEDVSAEYSQRIADATEKENLSRQLKQMHTELAAANSLNEIKPILIKLMRFISL
jgi:hypothetical protein